MKNFFKFILFILKALGQFLIISLEVICILFFFLFDLVAWYIFAQTIILGMGISYILWTFFGSIILFCIAYQLTIWSDIGEVVDYVFK